MLFVIDSNVYIFGFGFVKVPACSNLILTIIEKYNLHTLRISRRIVEEVRSHLSPEDFAKFIKVINILTKIDEDFVVPFEIAVKYEAKGFKPADAFIAAYTEWVGAIAGSCRDTVHRVPTLRVSAGSILQIEPQRLALARRAGTGQGVAKVGNTHHNPNVPGPGTHR